MTPQVWIHGQASALSGFVVRRSVESLELHGRRHEMSEEPAAAAELLQRGLIAVAARDWKSLRRLCSDGVTWRVPGHGPLAGTLQGAEAVVERYQLMSEVTEGDAEAQSVALLAGGEYAALVQGNWVTQPDGTRQWFTAITLVRAQAGRIALIESLVSDQDVVDALWTARMRST